jgi:polyphosphate kinase
VYGLIGLKTHCKLALVVRREGQGIRRYVHLGTGNYNAQTARQYTDLSLFTTRAAVADDVSALFNMLTGYAVPPSFKRLVVAPFGLHERLLELIRREADRARRGEPARIVAKMNSLVDAVMIRELYAASQAGVQIDPLVRSTLLPAAGSGGPDNIRALGGGPLLEHGRCSPRRRTGPGSPPQGLDATQLRAPGGGPGGGPGLRQRLLEEVLGRG